MKEKFVEAHRLTKKIKTENPHIGYRTQFAICLKFVLKNKIEIKKEFDINQSFETQKIFVDYVADLINTELEKNDDTDYFYSNRKTAFRFWTGGNNRRFYINSFFNFKLSKSGKNKTDETNIGFLFIDKNGKLQYGDGFNGIDNKFRNLIEKNYDSILKNVETKYNKKNELKNRTINAIKNFFEKSITPDAEELFIEKFNKIEFNFQNEIEKVKEMIDFGTVIAYEKLDEINFYNILSSENKKIINEIATEIVKQKSI